MMINPSINPNYAAIKTTKLAAPQAAAKEAAGQALPSDAADVNFNAPALSKAEALFAASAVEASELKGTLDPTSPAKSSS